VFQSRRVLFLLSYQGGDRVSEEDIIVEGKVADRCIGILVGQGMFIRSQFMTERLRKASALPADEIAF
jgi:hypothetical protein